MSIGEVRNRDDAKTRHDDFHRGQNADLLRAHADVIHRVNDDPREGDSFAEAHENIAQQESAQRRVESADTLPKRPAFGFTEAVSWRFAEASLHQQRRAGKNNRDDETDADAVDDAEAIDENAADDRRDHDRQSFDDRLDADAHGVPVGPERGADERERRGQREAGPGKKEKHARDDRAPMRDEQHERVADDREKIEGEKGAAMSPAIDEHAAGIRVDGAEQRAERIEKADDENARAEGLEIFREKPHPEFLAGADDERGNEQDDEVALEREKFCGATPEVHDRFHFISVTMILSKSRSDNSSLGSAGSLPALFGSLPKSRSEVVPCLAIDVAGKLPATAGWQPALPRATGSRHPRSVLTLAPCARLGKKSVTGSSGWP